MALPLALAGLLLFAVVRGTDRPLGQELRTGGWLPAYLVVLIVFSYLGSADFGGDDSIRAPWDSIVVGVLALAIYLWAIRAGVRHIERTAGLDVEDSPTVSEALSSIARGDGLGATRPGDVSEGDAARQSAISG